MWSDVGSAPEARTVDYVQLGITVVTLTECVNQPGGVTPPGGYFWGEYTPKVLVKRRFRKFCVHE